jgi:hypothetical protein
MTVALAQTGSDKSPSIVGASELLMRTAAAEGLTSPVAAGAVVSAAFTPPRQKKKTTTDAAIARAATNHSCTFPPGRVPRPMLFICAIIMPDQTA